MTAAESESAKAGQNKTYPKGLVVGIAVIVVLVIAGIGLKSLSNRATPAVTEAPIIIDAATEAPVVIAVPTDSIPVATDVPPTNTSVSATQAILSKFLAVKFSKDTGMDIFDVEEIGVGSDKIIDRTLSDDGLALTLNGQDLYLYYFYKPFVYQDVVVKLKAENLGAINKNIVSLVCRKTDVTWYEFSVTSDGLWFFYNYNESNTKRYTVIGEGGSTAIKTGKNANEYEMRCIGNEISLYINGQRVKTVKSDLYTEGQVGFNVSSLDLFPIEIKISDFEISKP